MDRSDSTADVLIFCRNGVIPAHRLVLASISDMFMSIFKQDTWDEPITILLKDVTVEEVAGYFQDFYLNGFESGRASHVSSVLGINESFLSNQRISSKAQNHIKNDAIKKEDMNLKIEEIDNFPTFYADVNYEDYDDDDDDYDYNYDDDYEDDNVKQNKKKQKVKKEKKEKVKKAKDSTEPEFKKTKAVTANKPSEARQYFHFNEEINGAECKLCQIKLSNNIKVIRTHLRYKHTEVFRSLPKGPRRGKLITHDQKKLAQYYSEIPDNPAKYNCLLCNSAITRANIHRHIQNKHKIYENGVPPQKHLCSFCGNTFRDKYDKDKHEYLQHKDSLPEGVESKFDKKSFIKKEFFCSDCGRKFTSKGNMDTHSCEGREGTFECQEEGCTLKFYNKLMLEKHVQSCYLFKNCRDAVNKLTCTVCNVKFPNFKNMKQHCIQSTTCTLIEKKPFQCEVCSKYFTTEKRYTLHMRVHTGETPFQCNLCLKKFKFNFKLTTHKCLQ